MGQAKCSPLEEERGDNWDHAVTPAELGVYPLLLLT